MFRSANGTGKAGSVGKNERCTYVNVRDIFYSGPPARLLSKKSTLRVDRVCGNERDPGTLLKRDVVSNGLLSL